MMNVFADRSIKRIWGLIPVIFLFSLSKAFAQTKVTLNYHHAKFEDVLNDIKKQTVYRFIYRPDQLPQWPVTVKANHQEALTVLQRLLKGSNYSFYVVSGTLIAISAPTDSTARIYITGVVTDEKTHEPINGASVNIKNTTNGAQTDVGGKFSLNCLLGGIIKVSSIGYAPKEIIIRNARDAADIRLEPLSSNLQEIVVTALNIKKDDRKVGYSVSTIAGDELTKARESNVALSLEGQVAGLNVSGVSGGPASSARLLLRGAANMSAGPPLIILDGIPIDNSQRGSANEYGGADYGDGLANINPDDIESITVLKGSAASALYGARAANGGNTYYHQNRQKKCKYAGGLQFKPCCRPCHEQYRLPVRIWPGFTKCTSK